MSCPNCNQKTISKKQGYSAKSAIFSNKNLFKCASCGLVFASPMPTDQELSKYYDTYWNGEVAIVSKSTKRYYLAQSISRIRYIKEHLNIEDNFKILDVGAGIGAIADALLKENIKCQYSAVEPDSSQRLILAKKDHVLKTYQDISNIATHDKFDLIVLSHVLEHVTNPNKFINELTKLLTKQGYLFIEVPNEDYKYKDKAEPHLLFFNKESLFNCIKIHGHVVDLCSVGKEIKTFRIAHSHPVRNYWLQRVKEIIKLLLVSFDKNHLNKQIKRLEMSNYGDSRQWLRAIIQKISA